jgi:hypothetical protein
MTTSGMPSNHRIIPRSMMLLLIKSDDNRLHNLTRYCCAISVPSTATARHHSRQAVARCREGGHLGIELYHYDSGGYQNDSIDQNEKKTAGFKQRAGTLQRLT